MGRSVLPSSVILLKHTLTEGRIPTSDILEVGEVALGLFKGQESIWTKNTDNKVVDLRTPRHDLFWGDLFIKFETSEEFHQARLAGEIKNTSLVFIKDTCQIWTDGIFYTSSYNEEEIEKIVLSKIISIPSSVFSLTGDSTSDSISKAIGGESGFLKIYEQGQDEGVVSSLRLPEGGQTPVSVISKRNGTEKILELEYLISGNYIRQAISLVDGIFSITKKGADLINLESRVTVLEGKIETLENLNGGEFIWVDINK